MRSGFGKTCLLNMIIRRQNSSKCVFHFHFSIESSSHEFFRTKISCLYLMLSYRRFLVELSVRWQLCLPVVTDIMKLFPILQLFQEATLHVENIIVTVSFVFYNLICCFLDLLWIFPFILAFKLNLIQTSIIVSLYSFYF